MKKIILANWKAQLPPVKAAQWLSDFKKQYKPCTDLQVIIAPSYLHLPLFKDEFKPADNVFWAAQDVSSFPPGKYTGSIPALWLSDLAGYVLVGHRERRRYFRETVQDVANKVSEAVAEGMTPILCMDREIAGTQIAALDDKDVEKIILAYTPEEAVSPESMDEIISAAEYFAGLSGRRPILYGGGVHKNNVAEIISSEQLAGVLTASASLDPYDFAELIGNAARSLATAS